MRIVKLIISLLLAAIFALLSAVAWYGWHTAGGYPGGVLALLCTAAFVGWYRCAMLDYEQATND